MTDARTLGRISWLWPLWLVLLALFLPTATHAREARFGDDNIAVELRSDGAPIPGKTWMLALHFTPSSRAWHGYWSNPGDAGQGMDLQLDLPEGWEAGEPLYPVPQTLVIAGLMNHIYEGEYAVLVPVEVPASAAATDIEPVTGFVSYLACTDRICVPQDAALRVGEGGDFAAWRARIAPRLDSVAGFEIANDRLRVGFPVPAGMDVDDVHLFLANADLGGGLRPQYAAVQTLVSQGNLLVVEMPLAGSGAGADSEPPGTLEGILSFGNGQGVRFVAEPRDVPLEGVKPLRSTVDVPPFWVLVLAALAGGLLLNIMPCVFPILSLKALALAKAGGDEASARRDALAYSAGVVLACAALGGLILLLRSAGEQVGWAFQLQEPLVVAALLILTMAITANFLGLFNVPGLAISGGKPNSAGSFATGLLAAFVATPCTGPFMALALGAALVLRPAEGFAIFAALGMGLALPFLLVGFVPAFRRRLPRPGAWMEAFRKWMALPMGLTVLALVWLVWRIAGHEFLALALAIAFAVLYILVERSPGPALSGLTLPRWTAVLFLGFAILMAYELPDRVHRGGESGSESLLDPQPFSEANLAQARASGKPVFVWFTADWCLTCKVNEQVAIEREETRAAFARAGVISLRGDWTLRDEEIATFLTRQGAAGVPLYLWYAPGSDAEQLPQVLTPDLLAGLAAGEVRSRSE